MKRWLLLAVPLVFACADTTAPNLVCTGAVEVDIHITRFGADTTAYCVVGVDTVYVPKDDDCDDDHGHGHGRHHRHGHHDHGGQR